MSPKILRRCTLCGRFHASYLVDDPVLGKCCLCYPCWKARQTPQPTVEPEPEMPPPGASSEIHAAAAGGSEDAEEQVRVGRKA